MNFEEKSISMQLYFFGTVMMKADLLQLGRGLFVLWYYQKETYHGNPLNVPNHQILQRLPLTLST